MTAEGAPLEFRIPAKAGDLAMTIIKTGDRYAIEFMSDKAERFTLIGPDTRLVATPRKGKVSFEGLAAGRYLLFSGDDTPVIIRVEEK